MSNNSSFSGKIRGPLPLINSEKKFMLYTNAKCGGTTLKSWFLDSLNMEETFSNTSQGLKNFGFLFMFKWYKYKFRNHDIEKIKFSNAYLRKFIKIYRNRTLKKIKKHVNDPDYYKIAVVRNPYDRLVSGYVDKFCGDDLNRSWVQEVIKEVNSVDEDGNYQISFSQFVDYLLRNNLMDVDAHWRHQTYNLANVNFDEIIDLKDMSTKLPELSNKLGFVSKINFNKRRQSNSYNENAQTLEEVYNITNTDLIKLKETNGSFPAKDAFYTDEIKQKVRTIYKEDFEAFDY